MTGYCHTFLVRILVIPLFFIFKVYIINQISYFNDVAYSQNLYWLC
jgi:hypothetical protein